MSQNSATPAIPAVNPRRWLILISVMAAGIMGPIDGSVVNVALPTISRVFNVDLNTVGWVAMAYLLVLGSLILTYGRLGDMYGFRRVLLMGIAIFTIASGICALAPNIWVLIAFRAIQAIGAGMFMAMGPAIITSVFPPYERGRALGTNGMIVAVGLALGPTLGGFLVTAAGWEAIFTINIPIGIISYILCRQVIPATRDFKPQQFDLVGAASGFFALSAFLLAGSYGEEWGWTSPATLILGLVFLIGAWFFIRWEKRVAEPMLDLTLFKNKVFTAANFAALMNFMSQYAMVFLLPFYLQQILNYTAGHTGLILTASPLVVLLLAPVSGALSDRLGTRWLAFTGQAFVSLALFLMAGLRVTSPPVDIIWRLCLFGLGTGIFQSPNNSAVMGSVPRHRLGIGSGVLATVRNVGMVLGIAVSSGVFTWQRSAKLAVLGPEGTTVAFMTGLRAAFLVGAFLAAAGALASLVRNDNVAG
ncbi:MFS transporter [Moorella sp. Hama-1]|uniref:MFS transporter n=1 Tax=Moorella sp. Hama-1 TaxID=2138101 RepID=UPI001F427C43|nr:MFS transporter [Moorella sp. Hama-1]BCV21286.1 MFS transporter [Moorella sp. Hama-1]